MKTHHHPCIRLLAIPVTLMYVCLSIPATAQTMSGISGKDTLSAGAPEVVSTPWTYTGTLMPDPAQDAWWKGFGDPLLDSLIHEAVTRNPNVLLAMRRMELGKLGIQQARSAYYPTLQAQAGWTKDRTSAYTGMARGRDITTDFFSLGLQMSWEIDVFGRVSSQVKQGKAIWQGSQADYAATMVSLCAQLAQSYIELRMYQAEYETAMRLSADQAEALRIAQVRHDAGLVSGLDVAQAKTVYYSTQASLPALQTSIDNCIYSIATLIDADVQSLYGVLSRSAQLPFYASPLPAPDNAELLRRRPDIVAAEAQMARYAAATGIAKKDFLPTLTLNASIGTAAHAPGNLFSHDAMTYTIQPTLTWTIFSGMSRQYAVAEARLNMEMAVENYRLTVLNASQELNMAMSAYRGAMQRIGMLQQVLAESHHARDLALDLYKQGLTPFSNVVDAEVNILNYSNQVVAQRASAQMAVVSLYKALGGGWAIVETK